MKTLTISGELLLRSFAPGKHNLDGHTYEVLSDPIPEDAVLVSAKVTNCNTLTLTLRSRESTDDRELTPMLRQISAPPPGGPKTF
jgi:hypothetical protein